METLYKQCRVVLEGKEWPCIMVNHWALNTKDQMVSDTTYLTGLASPLSKTARSPSSTRLSVCRVFM